VAKYAVAGVVTAGAYFSMTFAVSASGVQIQVAILVGWLFSLVIHFTLQRYFVFRSERGFRLRLHRQVATYLAAATTQYLITAAATAWLPDAIGLDSRIVYVTVALLAAAVMFFVLRLKVFHQSS